MADAQDDDSFVLDPIAQHVRPHRRHFAPTVAHIATAIGELGETVRHRNQALAKAVCRGGVEGGDVGDDRFEMADRFVGPDDRAQISRRRGGGAAAWRFPMRRSSV